MSVVPPPSVTLLGHAAVDPPPCPRPVGTVRVRLGFPSPAEDFEDDQLDLNQLLVRNPPATFFYRAEGRSMEGLGIYSGDVLVVDRSLTPADGDLVLALWDGNGPACKLLRKRRDGIDLLSGDHATAPIALSGYTTVEAFVVTGIVRQVTRGLGRHVRTR